MAKTQLLSFVKVFFSLISHLVINHWCWPDCAGCHFEVWQGSILRWRLHISAMTGCSPPCPPEVWKFEGPLASFVLLLSPSHRWTWTRLVLEAEEEAVIDFSFSLLLWLSGDGGVSAPRNRWIKWQRMRFLARSRSTDRWSNLTSSAPDRSPECEGERLNWLVKGLVFYIRADSTELWEAGLMSEIRTSGQ